MFLNSEFIAAELLLSVPVLEIVYESMKNTELTEEEMMFIIFLIAIAFSMLYTFYFGETGSSRDTTEAFTVSIIEGIIIAIIAFFVNGMWPSLCNSSVFGRSNNDCCNDCDNGCGFNNDSGCSCNDVAVAVRNVNGNCGCTSQLTGRNYNFNDCSCNDCANYIRRNTCRACNC